MTTPGVTEIGEMPGNLGESQHPALGGVRDYVTSNPVEFETFDDLFNAALKDGEIMELVGRESLSLFIELGSKNHVLSAITYVEEGNESDLRLAENEFSRFSDILAVSKNRFLSKERMALHRFGWDLLKDRGLEDYIPPYSRDYKSEDVSEPEIRSELYDLVIGDDMSSYKEYGLKSMVRAIMPTLFAVDRDDYHELYEEILGELADGPKSLKELYQSLNSIPIFEDGMMKDHEIDDGDWVRLQEGGEEASDLFETQVYSRYKLRNATLGLREMGMVDYESSEYRLNDDVKQYFMALDRPVEIEGEPTTLFQAVYQPVSDIFNEFGPAGVSRGIKDFHDKERILAILAE